MGVSAVEEQKANYCLSPKILQPPSDSGMEGPLESPNKKKSFSSSSFYEEPRAIYPTIEEQVKLCRQIAESLSDDCNQRSKGASMFFRRVEKAQKWIVAQSNGLLDHDDAPSAKDPSSLPYVRPGKVAPRLQLVLAPRPVVDLTSLLRQGVDIVQHDAVSPEVCHNLVRDLHSNCGKGSKIFAKRKKKSEEWVVDEDKVRYLLQERYNISYPSHSSPEPPVHPRVKALCEVGSVARSVIRAAEAKVMTYPNHVAHATVIHSLEAPAAVPVRGASPWGSEAYKCRSPKGWAGTSDPATNPHHEGPPDTSVEYPIHHLEKCSLKRTLSFNNFNASPRAWNAEVNFRPAGIKSVRPPSVLVQ